MSLERASQRTRIRWPEAVICLLLGAACVYGVKVGRKYVFLDNFGVVEEGAIYRSGQLKPFQFDKVIRKHGIKTVINTREQDAPARVIDREQAVCDANDAHMVRLMMPGDGRGTFEQYDEGLAILTDPEQLPALVHCARGTHRTGALIASYRVLEQGDDEERALEEMEGYRFKPEQHPLVPHLRAYWRLRKEGGAVEAPAESEVFSPGDT